jgi:hypothetical protein
MAHETDINHHVSEDERRKLHQLYNDFYGYTDDNNVVIRGHLENNGITHHTIATGTKAGFTTNDFSNAYKGKLDGIQAGALNNPHPTTHPWTMITGLDTIANTGSWNDLKNIPTPVEEVINHNYDAATVSGGIRITIGQKVDNTSGPANPQNNKELWIVTNQGQEHIEVYVNGEWKSLGAVFK